MPLRKVLGRLVAEQVPDFAFMYGEESLVAMALFVYTLGNAALLIALLSRKRLVFWLAVVFYIPLHLGLSLAYLKYLTSLIESLNNSSVGVAHPEIWMQALFSLASLLEILFVRWLFHLAGLRVVVASDRHP